MTRQLWVSSVGVAAAIGLVAFLAAPWYSGQNLDPSGAVFADLGEADAWQLLEVTDVALLVLALVIAVSFHIGRSEVSLVAAVIATGLVLYRILDTPADAAIPGGGERAVDVEWGAYAALATSAVAVVVSLMAYSERRRAAV